MAEYIAPSDFENEIKENCGYEAPITYPVDSIFAPAQFKKKFKQLKNALVKNLLGCDAKWCIFMEAAYSERCMTTVVPFLPTYIINDRHLLSIINKTPRLECLLQYARKKRYEVCDKFVILLLHYVLIEYNGPELEEVNKDDCLLLLDLLQQDNNDYFPIYAFKVCYQTSSTEEQKFKSESSSHATKYAYFGCNPDSLYQILCVGMRPYKESNDFESTICLRNEALVFLKECSQIPYLRNSLYGHFFKILLIMEYIDSTEYVSRRMDEETNSLKILIDSPKAVRCRYMVLFSDEKTPIPSLSDESMKEEDSEGNYLIPIGISVLWVASLAYIFRKNLKSLWMRVGQKIGKFLTSKRFL